MLTHIKWAVKYSDEDFQKALEESWESAALYYHSRLYNMDEKTPEQRALVRSWDKTVRARMPEKYNTGAHLLREGGGYMGEDVYVWNGNVQTTMHAHHLSCGSYSLLRWTKPIYCCSCDREIPESELGMG